MFWKRLNELMQEKNITFYKLSKETGITESAFSKWKKDKYKNPQQETVDKISQYFEVSSDYLLGKTDERDISNNVEEKDITLNEPKEEYILEKDIELYNLYKKLNNSNKKMLLDIGNTIFLYQKKNGNKYT